MKILIIILILFVASSFSFDADDDDDDHDNILLAAGKVGGTRNANDAESRKEVMELLEKHLSQLKGSWELKEIVNISRQIVAGVNWTVDGKFEEKNEGKLYRLIVKIYDIPWQKFTEGNFNEILNSLINYFL